MNGRAITAAAAVILGLVLLGAYDGGARLQGQTDGPRVFVASDVYAQSAGEQAAASRRGELTAAIVALREQTGSGWVGRQDDVTGYLAELSGGSFADGDDDALVALLFDQHGPGLFGVTAEVLGAPAREEVGDTTTLRFGQVVGDVPVRDGVTVVTVTGGADARRLTSVRGRLFPGLDVDTDPDLDARQAAAAAVAGSVEGATSQGEPRLVVIPGASGGSLAWAVTVVLPGTTAHAVAVEVVYVDAHGGTVIDTRPGGATESAARAGAVTVSAQSQPGESGQPVRVVGVDRLGQELQATATQRPDGSVVLVDTTTPWYDAASGRGAIATYDGTGLTEDTQERLPGSLMVVDGAAVTDPDAIAAHVASRYVLDYYDVVFGRSSWDGRGGSLTAVVNFGGPQYCNAFFSGALDPPMMVYGPPCVQDGQVLSLTYTGIDTAGHEITHGVTNTTADLAYTGQPGALNESFSDYFGNVIGDAFKGRDSATYAEESCTGVPQSHMCEPTTSEMLAKRDLMSGASMADYYRLLDPGGILSTLGGDQDHGGVHLNSSVWNNALWSVRTRLASIDGMPGVQSTRARTFDQVVYGALTRYLTPSSGFLDGRSALEQAASDLAVDATIVDVLRETFDSLRICPGCDPPGFSDAIQVAGTAAPDRRPAAFSDRVAWVSSPTSDRLFGQLQVAAPGGPIAALSAVGDVTSAAAAGDLLVATEWPDDGQPAVVAYARDGTRAVLDAAVDRSTMWTGVAGSPEGAAWVNRSAGTLHHVDPVGGVTSVNLPDVLDPDDQILSIAAGGGTVAIGTLRGVVVAWQVGSAAQVLQLDRAVLSVAAHGGRVLVMAVSSNTFEGIELLLPVAQARLVDLASGSTTVLSEHALPLGATLTERYAVWPEATRLLEGAVSEASARGGAGAVDSDLHLFSFDTGVTYSLLTQRGQQGYPSIHGNRIAWQDAVHGGDDVFSATLPDGL